MSARHILGLEKVPRVGLFAIKVARELGSERRETVQSLSTVGVRNLSGSDSSTRGPSWTNLGVSVVPPGALQSNYVGRDKR